METAFFRSVRAVAPKTLDELRMPKDEVVLRCVLPGCTACADFQPRRAAFERQKGWRHVLHWDCSKARRRALAQDAGVDALPAYVVVPPRGPVRVVVPT